MTIQFLVFGFIRNIREKNNAKQKYRKELKELAGIQEAFRLKELNELDEENKRIAAFLVLRNAREDARKQADNDKKGRSSDLAEKMGNKLWEDEVSCYLEIVFPGFYMFYTYFQKSCLQMY